MKEKKYEESFKWAVYGMSVAAFMFVLGAIYLIVRIIDGQWANWKLPAIFVIIFFVGVSVSAMFISSGDIKAEIEKNKKKKEKD